MSERNPIPKAPQHLSKAAKIWWQKLCAEYDLSDSAAQILLESALAEFDRAENARKILAREGAIVRDRFGQRQAHPAVGIARDARGMMIRAFKALCLDLEPLRDGPGRPPGR
jgi:P27 family predicted phage terminase small subunit